MTLPTIDLHVQPRAPKHPASSHAQRRLGAALRGSFPVEELMPCWAGPPRPARNSTEEETESADEHDERRLQEALHSSFPCSDPLPTWAGTRSSPSSTE